MDRLCDDSRRTMEGLVISIPLGLALWTLIILPFI